MSLSPDIAAARREINRFLQEFAVSCWAFVDGNRAAVLAAASPGRIAAVLPFPYTSRGRRAKGRTRAFHMSAHRSYEGVMEKNRQGQSSRLIRFADELLLSSIEESSTNIYVEIVATKRNREISTMPILVGSEMFGGE